MRVAEVRSPFVIDVEVHLYRLALAGSFFLINNNNESIYKAQCVRVIKPAQRRYTKVNVIPE